MEYKMRADLTFVIFLCLLNISVVNSDATFSDVATVLRHLMSNYTNEVRPVTNQSEPVVVKVLPILRSVNSYEEITSALTLTLILNTEWTDDNLKWDPKEYGVSSMVLPQNNLWKPELFLLSSGADIEPIGSDKYKIRVLSNGTLLLATGGTITSSCAPNLRIFPFDTQTCHLNFMTMGFTKSEVKFEAIGSDIQKVNVTENGAWEIKETSFKVYEASKYSVLELSLSIERKSLYYILTFLLPVFLLCALNPMVFTLPYSSGERVSFCITILLSFAVFMTLTGSVIPRVSNNMPMLLVFLFAVQTFSGIICSLNIMITRTYNRNDDEPVPARVQKFVLIVRKTFKRRQCSRQTSIHPKDSGISKTAINELKEADQKMEQKSQEPVLWSTVAKTLDSVCFVISLILLLVISLGFILRVIDG